MKVRANVAFVVSVAGAYALYALGYKKGQKDCLLAVQGAILKGLVENMKKEGA